MIKRKFTGKSEEEALARASEVLGKPSSQLQWEVVGRKGGLIGLLSPEISIEVTLEGEAEPPAVAQRSFERPVAERPQSDVFSRPPVDTSAEKRASGKKWDEEDEDGPQPGNTLQIEVTPPDMGNQIEGNRPDRGADRGPPRFERPREDRGPRPDRPRGDRPRDDRGPRPDRPRDDRPRDDRPPRPEGDRGPRPDRPRDDRPRDDRPRDDRPRDDRPRDDRPRDDRPREDRSPRPEGDRGPRSDRPREDRFGHGNERRPDSRPPRPRREDHDSTGDDEMETQVVDEAIFEQKMAKAKEMMDEIVRLVGGQATVSVARREAEITVSITGSLPDWVGRGHNRVVEALQFLANKIVNRFPPRYRVVIQVEGAKDQRSKELEEMSLQLVQKVQESGKPVWILPMSAKERRLVHMTVASHEGIASRSVGDGPTRRLCISKAVAPSAQQAPAQEVDAPAEEAPVEQVAEPVAETPAE